MAHQIRVGLLSLSSCFLPCHLFFWIVNDYFTSTSSTKAVFFLWKKSFSLCFFSFFFFKLMHCFHGHWIAHHITQHITQLIIMHYLLLLAAMQYLQFGIKAGDGPHCAAQPPLIDRHNGSLETWRIENGSSGDCKCYEFFISNSWPALTQRILDFLGANMLYWNVLKKLNLNSLQWCYLPPPSIIVGLCQADLPLPPCNPWSLLPASRWLPYVFHADTAQGSRRQWGGVSEYTIRSWRRLLWSPGFYSRVTWIGFTAGRPEWPLAASSHFCWLLP